MGKSRNMAEEKRKNLAIVEISPELFSLEAVFNAAYALTERAYVLIDGDPDSRLYVELLPKGKGKAELLAREFQNELIAAQVYLMESERQAKITESIVEEAITSVQSIPERENEEPQH